MHDVHVREPDEAGNVEALVHERANAGHCAEPAERPRKRGLIGRNDTWLAVGASATRPELRACTPWPPRMSRLAATMATRGSTGHFMPATR